MSDTSNLTSLGSNGTTYTYDNPNKDTLETFDYEANHLQVVSFITDEFTSLCPKTAQPDFASINITYIPSELGVESKSLKLYLFSYRNHGSFHEDCVAKIAQDIFDTIKPHYLRVVGDFTKRGGIAIKPVSVLRGDAALQDEADKLINMNDTLRFTRQ